MQFYRPTSLAPDKHQRREFTCGQTSLDEWLHRYAGQNRQWQHCSVAKSLSKVAPQHIPALLIDRLATNTRVAGLGLGTAMVKHSLATAAELNIKTACRAVVVIALNADAFPWWQRFGFGADDMNSMYLAW